MKTKASTRELNYIPMSTHAYNIIFETKLRISSALFKTSLFINPIFLLWCLCIMLTAAPLGYWVNESLVFISYLEPPSYLNYI